MSGPALSIADLSVEFHGDHGTVRAVDRVSVELGRGEVLGLVGESGSGKSTIAMAVLGLLPAAGKVVGGNTTFDGRDLLQLRERELQDIRGKRIAMIFQDPMTSLTPWLSIGTQLCEMIQTHSDRDRQAARAHAVSLLDQVGVPDPAGRLDSYPHEFSGGQRQRILIAMALSCDPEVLIADEPTTALDVTIQAQVLALLKKLQRDRGLSLILVTHDMGVVAGMCDRVAVLYRGRIVELATTDDLFADPRHPYTRGLLGAVPSLDGPRGTHLPTVDHAAIATELTRVQSATVVRDESTTTEEE